MAVDRQFTFGQVRFDPRTGELCRDGNVVKLTPRAAAVLCALAESAQQLVTKQELFDRVWGGRAVSDDALTSCIQELRGALGDDARRPRYIETRHRRGYRLMVPAGTAALSTARRRPRRRSRRAAGPRRPRRRAGSACARLRAGALGPSSDRVRDRRARHRQERARRCVSRTVTRTHTRCRIAHGQCLDHHGVGEPYLPLIEALTRLAGAPDGAAVKKILATQAPSWLAQMPSLWTRAERSALEARGRATRERMLRELTLAVEAIAADAPLLLKLEDIHWSDASTLDWLAPCGAPSGARRLMVLATFRPADAAADKVGLGGLVVGAGAARTMPGDRAPSARLSRRSKPTCRRGSSKAGAAQAREMAPLLLERTGGNPLFMTSIVNQLAQRDASPRRQARSSRSRTTCDASSIARSTISTRAIATC